MDKRIKKIYKQTYRFYAKQLSNFNTVLKDTNNHIITAEQEDYNCMSYALGVYDDWLCIDAFRQSFVYDFNTREFEENHEFLKTVFTQCCEELVSEWPLRRVSGPDAELEAGERMIAFRIGIDDFHFARKNSDGTWTHKPGRNYIREMTEEELLGEAWSEDRYYPYTSEIAFFAFTEEQ